jgi:hypothetical protein
MNQAGHIYTPPREHSAKAIPAALVNYLNGENLLAKTQALRLSTVDADGWPHAALLSAGDVLLLAAPPCSITRNIRTGRAVFFTSCSPASRNSTRACLLPAHGQYRRCRCRQGRRDSRGGLRR